VVKIIDKGKKGAKPEKKYYSIYIAGATKVVEFHDEMVEIE